MTMWAFGFVTGVSLTLVGLIIFAIITQGRRR